MAKQQTKKKAPAKRGRRDTSEQRAQAYDLFVNSDLTQERIAEIVNVRPMTISRWVNANGEQWKIDKAARSVTTAQIISAWYKQLFELNRVISERPDGERFATAKEADIMSKLSTQIEKLEKKHSISNYMNVCDELVDFILRRSQKIAKELSLHVIEFIKDKSRQLNNG